MTTLNFLEEGKRLGKGGTVALIEAGSDGERCGASRWTMAYLRLDKDNRFDDKWKDEMALVSNGLADQDYCRKMEQEVPHTAQYLLDHDVKLNHYDEPNVLLEFDTNQHFVSPEGGGHAVINALFSHIRKFDNVDIIWETMAEKLLTTEEGEVCGVSVRRPGGKTGNVHGKRIMLACGGFEGNKEQLVLPLMMHVTSSINHSLDADLPDTSDQELSISSSSHQDSSITLAGVSRWPWM